MTVSAHLSCIVAALAEDVVPVVEGNERARSAVSSTLDVLRRLIVNAQPEYSAGIGAAAASLGLSDPPPSKHGEQMLDTPDEYLGGEAFVAQADRAAAAITKDMKPTDFVKLTPVVEWENEGLARAESRWEALRRPPPKDNNEAELRISSERLLAYLCDRFPDASNLALTEFRQLAGGRSKQTALFRVSGLAEIPEVLVIRRDHPIGITKASVVDEFPLLTKLHAAGLAVAQPHLVEPSKEHLGGAFMISSAVEGRSAGELFEPRHSVRLARALAIQVARLHAQPLDEFVALSPIYTVPGLQAYESQLQGFEEMWDRCEGPSSPSMRTAFAWLKKNLELTGGNSTLIHGDLGFHNVLADGDRFHALLDWEFTRSGNPAEDLGYLRPTIEQMMDWSDWMGDYRAAGGANIAEEQVDYFAMWSAVRLGSLVAYARMLVNSGALLDVAFALSSAVDMNRIRKRVTDGLRRTLALK